MTDGLSEWIQLVPSAFVHGSNLRFQTQRMRKDGDASPLLGLLQGYREFFQGSRLVPDENALGWIQRTIPLLNTYSDLLATAGRAIRSHQSDFISSLIPEYTYRLLEIVCRENPALSVIAQRDIIIECVFAAHGPGLVIPTKKKVDVAIVQEAALSFNGSAIDGFAIPVVCVEVKTNLDKNMISGIENSVATLKQTFPASNYFVIAELADFTIETQNYASTAIDEIYLARRQKRSAVRRGGSRKPIDAECFVAVADAAGRAIRDQGAASLIARMKLGHLIRDIE